MGTDTDDVGALAVLHALADRGEADILATVSSVHDPYSAAAIDVINTYYGRPDLPIGRNADPEQLPIVTPWWREHKPRFVRDLAERFPNDLEIEAVPPAASVYREVLAAQPDDSVTVITVGFMSNLAALLTSGPDEHSPLSGEDLVRRKVKKLAVMGGTYPSSSRDLNLRGSEGKIPATEAIRVLEEWPTKITFTPGKVCGDVLTGQTLAKKTPESNPVREGYRLFFNRSGVGRESWDLCTVLYAVRGLTGPEDAQYFTKPEGNERLTMSQSGRSAWISPGDGLHERLTRELPKERMETLLESLLVTPPKR